jgi:hypothetical protein
MPFLEKLRMNNIFNGDRPFTLPDFSKGEIDPNYINRVVNQLSNNGQINQQPTMHDPRINPDLFEAGRRGEARVMGGSLQRIANPPGQAGTGNGSAMGQRAILPAPMSDYQRAQIDLERQGLAQKQALTSQDQQIRQQRADVYEFKAKNPNARFDFSGPTVLAANPLTGEVYDTGVDTGSLSDREKIELQGEQRMSEIGARTAGSKELQDLRNTGNLAAIAARGSQARQTNAAKPPTAGSTPSATQELARQYDVAQRLINTNPSLAGAIKLDPTSKTFVIEGDGPLQRMAREQIYGKQIPDPNVQDSTKDNKPSSITKPKDKPKSNYKVTIE